MSLVSLAAADTRRVLSGGSVGGVVSLVCPGGSMGRCVPDSRVRLPLLSNM